MNTTMEKNVQYDCYSSKTELWQQIELASNEEKTEIVCPSINGKLFTSVVKKGEKHAFDDAILIASSVINASEENPNFTLLLDTYSLDEAWKAY
ncbi:MAG: hypothetical protein WCQ32_02815 [bacterium]